MSVAVVSHPSTITPPNAGPEPLLTSKQAAELLHIHPKTLERKARLKEVPGHFKFNRWYFLASELDDWLRSDVDSGSQFVCVN